MRRLFVVLAALTAAACTSAPAERVGPELLPGDTRSFSITGELTRKDFQTYREIAFHVPPDVARLSIALTYEGREQRTVVDMGLRDPVGQRGWSGGNKSVIWISEFDATPGYRAGPITPGDWTLVLGVPSIREGVTSTFEARVTLQSAKVAAASGVFAAPLSRVAGWRRGDFHTHTGHSDGSCAHYAGGRTPCPVVRTLEAARSAGLDFVAVTDHNTLSQMNSLRELQTAFPLMLAIPGSEITTFRGHANAIGLAAPVDFQLGSARLTDTSKLLDQVQAQGAILSVNHPGQPSGEDCMGCGWTADVDWSRVTAIEAENGSSVRAGRLEGPGSGLAFWEARLNEGFRIAAIGGSDNHDALDKGTNQSPVGTPATVVWASDLSPKGIVEGVKAGRVFIDLANTADSVLDVRATAPDGTAAQMGGVLMLKPGEEGLFYVETKGVPDGKVEIVSGGLDVSLPRAVGGGVADAGFTLKAGAKTGWIRANVRDAAGKLVMVSNPVHVQAA